MRPIILSMSIGAIGLGGCATMPDVAAPYRLPRADATFTVTRTIGCNAAATEGTPNRRILYSTVAVVPLVAYSADPGPEALMSVDYAALETGLSDTSMGLEWTEDGRLKAINSTTTGQGTAIIQAVAQLVPLVAAASGAPTGPSDAQQAIDTFCKAFDEVSADGKPVAMIYEHGEDFAPRRPGQDPSDPPASSCRPLTAQAASDCLVAQQRFLALSPRSTDYGTSAAGLRRLNDLLPQFCVSFERLAPVDTPRWLPERSAAALRLRAPVQYRAKIQPAPRSGQVVSCDDAAMPFWTGQALVPLTEAASLVALGTNGTYDLPIPRGAPFGGNAMKLTLADSGSITALSYGSTSGMAGAVGAVGAVGGSLQQVDVRRAANYEAEANVIAQQQRLIRCQQTPSTCE
jgi:hypothetical protein